MKIMIFWEGKLETCLWIKYEFYCLSPCNISNTILFTLQIARMAGASHYDGIKKQVSKNDQLEEDKKTVKVDKLILTIGFPGSITFLFIEYAFHLLMIRWLWWEIVLWARLASALFIHRSRNYHPDYRTIVWFIYP